MKYLNEEANCTEPSPLVSIPWLGPLFACWKFCSIGSMFMSRALVSCVLLFAELGEANILDDQGALKYSVGI